MGDWSLHLKTFQTNIWRSCVFLMPMHSHQKSKHLKLRVPQLGGHQRGERLQVGPRVTPKPSGVLCVRTAVVQQRVH